MHTNSTPNYNLPQFVSTDKPTWLGDVNGAMSAIDTAIAGVNSTATGADSKADNAVTTANTAATTAGNAATLAETANTNASSALTTAGNAATAAQSAASLAQTAKNEADAVSLDIGDIEDLTTTVKTDLVAAINEVNAKPSGSGDAEDITYDNTTSGLTATNVQEAIDELAAGLNPPLFTWTGADKTWTNGLQLQPTAGTTAQSVVEMTEAIPAGCTLYYAARLNYNVPASAQYPSRVIVGVRVHGSSGEFAPVITYTPDGSGGNVDISESGDLSSYAGQILDIAVSTYNGSNAGQTLVTQRCDVTNASV